MHLTLAHPAMMENVEVKPESGLKKCVKAEAQRPVPSLKVQEHLCR
jgi:hypothetical protein